MKKFAAFFYGYFYFFGFSVEKVRVRKVKGLR